MKKYYLEGSFTIEASIISILIFSVIIFILASGIYLHEINALNLILNDSAIVAEDIINSKAEYRKVLGIDLYDTSTLDKYISTELETYIINQSLILLFDKKELKDNLYIDINVDDQVFYKKVSIKLSKKSSSYLYNVALNLFSNSGDVMVISREFKVYSKEDVARNINLLDDLTNSVESIADYKSKYYKKLEEIQKGLENFF